MSCTPANSGKLFAALAENDYDTAAAALNNILELRDSMAAHGIWQSFTAAMNMLGYEGDFAPDFASPIAENYVPELRELMVRIGEPV